MVDFLLTQSRLCGMCCNITADLYFSVYTAAYKSLHVTHCQQLEFPHVLEIQPNARQQYVCSSPTVLDTHVINYERERPRPACQHGLLLWLGRGHSGHGAEAYHASPAGSWSSGPVIDPGPAEQTAALDVTLFPRRALARTQRDSLMGHQNKPPVRLANIKVMNDKYHSPTALLLLRLSV